MFVIVTYDVSQKRVTKVMKICRKYLNHIQNSVFEGMITDGKLSSLKKELSTCIVCAEDSVVIYEIQNLKYTRKELIGVNRINDNIF
ncbi:CRISPR-associated endonuclease Cas2 [Agathobacter rectalis]|jgi:CRISPR-associated endoribonuclease cas2|uniref:CRISPR-associated endoribonuclease Cas2 n=2 Tax=Agathobacter rectalis TaxID=39491 RepID=A0A395V2N4_9FIRM|nr:CRISPR-associated endonuclease Cas2 [Agathobacter rectalis]RGI67530.1 CRISPR-associated endonuclease Cas2 [Agathobacter rectalis]RGR54905.1 CRISPR-associated endonuclease Cas2 [Agathobacter rectalis]RGT83196.1 CRISPR-associated endonuclease Cas2 [Agathobacter rectalis]RGZ91327.1 CRISPR-associated endonuclease Cas2 [Agathobacter rectalis]